MYLSIRHTTAYSYEQPVILEPHTLRLTPRIDAYRKLIERTLTIIPEPDGLSEGLDCNGSLAHIVWFKRPSTSLTVVSKVVLELNEINPFDYIVHPPSCMSLYMKYPPRLLAQLGPFLSNRVSHERVKEFAAVVMNESKNNTLDFCFALCREISAHCAYEARREGEPHPPEKVLALRRGSCRDLAVLYVAVARAVGLAARFVSGYYFDNSPKHPQLHAWAEVFIPGGGWRGYDPTLGLACYGHHIPLASGVSPHEATPVEGTFLGQPASRMEARIEYEYLKQVELRGHYT